MKLAAIALWLLAGAGVAAGVYWGFLITPESTAGSLALSALLMLTALLLAGTTISGALLAWRRGWSPALLRPAAANAAAIIPAAIVIGAVWWVVGRATGAATIYSGQITAWFMASLGWSDVSGMFTAFAWIATWLRWVVAPMLALSLTAAIVDTGWSAIAQPSWLTRALSPRRLTMATLWFGLLIGLPWTYLAPWRPAALPPTSIELAFIITKLGITALLMAVGAALFIRESLPRPPALHAPST
jgi:hypothetical protein